MSTPLELCPGYYCIVFKTGGDPMVPQEGIADVLAPNLNVTKIPVNYDSVWVTGQPSAFAAGGEIEWKTKLQNEIYLKMDFEV